MIKKLKRYRIDYDGKKLFHEEHPNGEHVKYADILPLIENLESVIKRLRDCCKDFEFVLEGSRAVKQSEEMLDKRESALMRALDWDNSKKSIASVGVE